MAECDRWAPVFRVRTCSYHSIFLGKVVQFVMGYNSVLYCAQTPKASMCCIRSEVKFPYSARAPNWAHARHGSLCAIKHRIVALDKSYNISIGLIYMQGVADPKERARAPLWRRHGGVFRKGSGMGTPSLKLNTYRWKLPEKWYQVARTLGKSPKKSSEIARTLPNLKVRMHPGDLNPRGFAGRFTVR